VNNLFIAKQFYVELIDPDAQRGKTAGCNRTGRPRTERRLSSTF